MKLITNVVNCVLQNLFHIRDDEAKRNVFLSELRERFTDFKSVLTRRWIKPALGAASKVDGNGEKRMPYDIYTHITKTDWVEFVRRRSLPEAIVCTKYHYTS